MSYNSFSNSKIKYGEISTTPIDMEFKDLINVRNPIQPQDAVPKSYVDSLTSTTSNYQELTITLTDMNPTIFYGALTGVYTFVIQSTDSYGPKAKFNVAKNDQSKIANIQRTINSPGINNCNLQITWNANVGIGVYKNTTDYNGNFTVSIIDSTTTSVTVPNFTFTLSGTTPVTISSDLTGLHLLKITSQVQKGPIGSFELAKSDQTQNANINNLVITTTDTNEILIVTWNANSGIAVHKTGANYDGTYTVYFIF